MKLSLWIVVALVAAALIAFLIGLAVDACAPRLVLLEPGAPATIVRDCP